MKRNALKEFLDRIHTASILVGISMNTNSDTTVFVPPRGDSPIPTVRRGGCVLPIVVMAFCDGAISIHARLSLSLSPDVANIVGNIGRSKASPNGRRSVQRNFAEAVGKFAKYGGLSSCRNRAFGTAVLVALVALRKTAHDRRSTGQRILRKRGSVRWVACEATGSADLARWDQLPVFGLPVRRSRKKQKTGRLILSTNPIWL